MGNFTNVSVENLGYVSFGDLVDGDFFVVETGGEIWVKASPVRARKLARVERAEFHPQDIVMRVRTSFTYGAED